MTNTTLNPDKLLSLVAIQRKGERIINDIYACNNAIDLHDLMQNAILHYTNLISRKHGISFTEYLYFTNKVLTVYYSRLMIFTSGDRPMWRLAKGNYKYYNNGWMVKQYD